jgi:hypothetical protein
MESHQNSNVNPSYQHNYELFHMGILRLFNLGLDHRNPNSFLYTYDFGYQSCSRKRSGLTTNTEKNLKNRNTATYQAQVDLSSKY